MRDFYYVVPYKQTIPTEEWMGVERQSRNDMIRTLISKGFYLASDYTSLYVNDNGEKLMLRRHME